MSEAGLNCPRCEERLAGQEGDLWHCDGCGGSFATGVELGLPTESVEVASDGRMTCPACRDSMERLMLGAVEIDRCASCQGIWLDAGEQLPGGTGAEAIGRYLVYSMTLPERLVRSAIGLGAGTAWKAAGFLIPQAFQSSKTYEIVIDKSLRFLAEDIGGAAKDPEQDEGMSDYMARKAVGNFVELAGMATLHVSPLWLLAIVSDVAYGTQSYVRELAGELKEHGLIDETSTVYSVDDLLENLRNASGTAAGAFDTPPINVDQLKQTLNETRQAISETDYTRVLPEAELTRYWIEMKEIAERENVTLLDVSAAMTMSTLGKVRTVASSTLLGVQVAGGLLHRGVVMHYVSSLQSMHERGYYATVRDACGPYVEAVWNNFAENRSTWTADLVTGRTFASAWKAMRGWFAEKDADGTEPGDPETDTTDPETP